ncbi:hypothetical protein LguiB_022422 [Lonicera macranthoides]
MATITKPHSSSLLNFLTTKSSSSSSSSSSNSYALSFTPKSKTSASKLQTSHTHFITKVTASSLGPNQESTQEVQQVRSIEEFDESLRLAKNELVVVGFASTISYQSTQICQFMSKVATQSRIDFRFLLVMGNETEQTIKLCKRENITKFPRFIFYKNMEKVHEEEGFKPKNLIHDLFYYGEKNSPVVQLHGREDVDKLIEDHRANSKLIVLKVGLKNCGPCMRIYPTVINLSRQMGESVIFARMSGDENESCMEFLREMEVVKVPTFLFVKDGEIWGRYVGSRGGELLREIIKCQRILNHVKRGNGAEELVVVGFEGGMENL